MSNLPASVAARLLNRAHATGEDYQTLLTRFCLERFLYRLGVSAIRDRFILKGAMLLRAWSDQPYRATRDLDLLRAGSGTPEAMREDLRAICAVPVQPDGIVFETGSIRIEAIRHEDESAGSRALFTAKCGTARLPLQIDLGVGDSVWPRPQACAYPAMLEFPAPDVLAYPREAVVAEKLDALVVLGDRNSRIKDFFDLHHLASRFSFDRVTLAESIRGTFTRRHTPVPAKAPIGLTPAYWENPSRPAQIRSFATRAGLPVPGDPGREFAPVLGAFLLPVLDDLHRGLVHPGTWPPRGPWHPPSP